MPYKLEVVKEMNYWLTTHWPRPQNTPASEPYADVYVKDGQWKVIEQLTPGDLVFMYQSESGPLPLRLNPDKGRKVRGKGSIVALVRVIEPAKQPPESAPEMYDNGEEMWWRFRAATEPVNSGGFISRKKLLPVLGYSTNWNLHGFGDNHSGVKRLTADEFHTLRKMYEEDADREDQERVKIYTGGGQFGGPGGEGEIHRKLKERIATNPAAILLEEGLSLYKVEFPFKCTGDRIDVVLRDKDKRFVAVEVEVECDQHHLAGPLQCMKYRAMLAYLFKRPIKEVRCILAAHMIAPEVDAYCAAYEIETITIAKDTDRQR
jgi:hypothetical protein